MKHNLIVRAGLIACLALQHIAASAGDYTKTILPFNGKDLSGWRLVGASTNQWQVGNAVLDPADLSRLKVAGPGDELISAQLAANLVTEASFGDCRVELEFLIAKNSNSGVKMMSIYEIQILDSFGKKVPDYRDSGAVYGEQAPIVNAAKPPGEWQTLVIDFLAPRFDSNGKKTANAKFVKVTLNGQVVQENVEIAHGTNVARKAPEHAFAPLYLQGDHGPVAFRNLKIFVPEGSVGDH